MSLKSRQTKPQSTISKQTNAEIVEEVNALTARQHESDTVASELQSSLAEFREQHVPCVKRNEVNISTILDLKQSNAELVEDVKRLVAQKLECDRVASQLSKSLIRIRDQDTDQIEVHHSKTPSGIETEVEVERRRHGQWCVWHVTLCLAQTITSSCQFVDVKRLLPSAQLQWSCR